MKTKAKTRTSVKKTKRVSKNATTRTARKTTKEPTSTGISHLYCYVTPQLKKWVIAESKKQNVSQSKYVTQILAAEYKRVRTNG